MAPCFREIHHNATDLAASLSKVLGDAQHVRVLSELSQVLLQLLFVPGDLAELSLQPLQLLLRHKQEGVEVLNIEKRNPPM